MRRILLCLTALLTIAAPMALSGPVQAAPPGPQCGAVMPCDGPVEKVRDTVRRIVEMCQNAYCQPLP